MEYNSKFFLKLTSVLAVVLIIGGYSYYKSKNLINGPVLNIQTPISGQIYEDALINIEGKALNISHISLNDRAITVDSEGNFKDKTMLSPGYNVLKLSVKDRFGKEKIEILELVHKESEARRASRELIENELASEEAPL